MGNWRRLGIIAGAGALPVLLANAASGGGNKPFVVRLEGVAEERFDGIDKATLGIAEVGRIIRALKDAGCDAVALAGVVRRPDFSALKPDWRGMALLPRVIAAAGKGDGALLAVLVETLEAEGFRVVGAEDVLADLAAPAGAFGSVGPETSDWPDITKAAAIVAALGPFDVGQAAIVAGGFTLGIEAAEGTDAMLERCAPLHGALCGPERRGVLVKRPKPGQELRVDLPTIGVETVRRASAVNLAGIAVEAGAALVIDREGVIREANAAGLFIYGFNVSELKQP